MRSAISAFIGSVKLNFLGPGQETETWSGGLSVSPSYKENFVTILNATTASVLVC